MSDDHFLAEVGPDGAVVNVIKVAPERRAKVIARRGGSYALTPDPNGRPAAIGLVYNSATLRFEDPQ
ncbi:hypothetical protein P2H44_22635 [Albimonas sp. CAU 1670]|uniref:hypothetical protein n=1 Tax=Albimonas sp. CAU 1670 TaxID=3032599 RepID=UPI0023DBF901|nr:hypothetical protein [Albimonas sp. CAU 1670]MDF2235362.1 hypothetical protein [Albimonas sp. CAU 1670]